MDRGSGLLFERDGFKQWFAYGLCIWSFVIVWMQADFKYPVPQVFCVKLCVVRCFWFDAVAECLVDVLQFRIFWE